MNRIAGIYKKAYSGLSPATWWLCLVMLINRSGTMVVPFMTLYLTTDLGYSLKQSGIVMALFGAGAICGGILGGRLSDKFGFYNVQLIALAGGGAFFIILGQMHSFPLICICTFLLSVVNDSFRPANSIAVAQYSSEENRTRSFSLNRLAINLGWAAGGSLGGFIASKEYELLFWVDGLTNIGAAILLLIVLSPKRSKQTPKKHTPIVRDKKQLAMHDRPYLVFIVLNTIFAACFFQLFTTITFFYKNDLHLDEQFIGIVMALNGVLIALFEMVIVHKLEGKRHELSYIAMGVFVVGLSFISFNIFPGAEILAIFAMLLCTMGEILSMPFMNSFWIGRSNDNNRGQYAGLYTISWSIAQVSGPWAGTYIADTYGFTTLWWVVGGLLFTIVIGYRSLHRSLSHQRV